MPVPAHYDLIGTQMPWWLVISCRNRWYLKNFVELGAGYGHTSAIACDHFQRVWSVELVPDVFSHQVAELKQAKNARRLQGSTVEHLPAIIRALDAPTLFYIDSHWPCGPKIAAECPLLEELAILQRERNVTQDVVLIDNYGMFEKPPRPPHNPAEWPNKSQTIAAVQALGLEVQIIADVLAATPSKLFEVL